LSFEEQASILPQPYGYGNEALEPFPNPMEELQFCHNLTIMETPSAGAARLENLLALILLQPYGYGNTSK